MQIISRCTILFILILNKLCTGKRNEDQKTLGTSEVPAVSGLCCLISYTFTNSERAKLIQNIQLNVDKTTSECNKTEERLSSKKNETNEMKWFELDLTKNNCSITVKEIEKDKSEYVLKIVGSGQNKHDTEVKIIIQDNSKMDVSPLSEGQEANLTCSAPFPCPDTPPEIAWWIRTRGVNINDLKDNKITLTISKSLSMLTFTLTSDLHNTTIGCDVNYGSKNISTNMRDTNESKVNNIPQNATSNTTGTTTGTITGTTTGTITGTTTGTITGTTTGTITGTTTGTITGITEFFKKLGISEILTFVTGMACSALIFSVVLCCWVSCRRGKKHKVPTANPDTEVNLEMVQTDVAQTGTNEETPLHGQLNGGNSNTAGPTDGAEEDEAVRTDVKEADYASIDYSLLKDKAPEEGEKEPTNTDYAEIKRDKKGEVKEKEDLQDGDGDGDDQIETQDQMEGEEERYSNSQELKS